MSNATNSFSKDNSSNAIAGNRRHSSHVDLGRFTYVSFLLIFCVNTWILLHGSPRPRPLPWQQREEAEDPSQAFVGPETTVTLPSPPRRLAVAQFIDSPSHLYGAFSIKNQMTRFNMTRANDVSFVAVVPNYFRTKHSETLAILNEWFDEVQLVDKKHIHNKLDDALWKGTFNKLWLFNLTSYDKVIVLDADIMILRSILHWFDFETPSAVQQTGGVVWNSGAMVIAPNKAIFDDMIRLLPEVKPYTGGTRDNWNTWISDQGLISAYFTQQGSNHTMKTMPLQSSIISKRLDQQHPYWMQHRSHVFETVHMTLHKPWSPKTAPKQPILCKVLRLWKNSIQGIESYYPRIEPIRKDYLRNCPKV